MERIYIRENSENPETNIEYLFEKQKIGVVGMSSGAGCSFVALSLAKVLSGGKRKVTFLEICDRTHKKRTLLYDSMGFDKRFHAREFVGFYSEIKNGNSIRGMCNPDEKINWGLITPGDIKEELVLAPIEIVRLSNNISGEIIVCDISDCENSEDYLLDMDFIIFVIDPMPSKIISGYPFMREVKRLAYGGKKIVWVLNKCNDGINKRDMQNFLKLKEHYKIPLLDAGGFYSAEYNCRMPYEVVDIRNKIKETFEKIIKNELVL